MGKRLERFGEVRIIDETNGFGVDFVEKTESRFWSTTPDVGAVLSEQTLWKNKAASICKFHPFDYFSNLRNRFDLPHHVRIAQW